MRGHPRLSAVTGDAHRAVHRLHRGVSQEGTGVSGFHCLHGLRNGGGCIAYFALPEIAIGRQTFAQHRVDGGAGFVAIHTVVPHHRQFSQSSLRTPEGVCHHGQGAVVDFDDTFDATHLGDLALVVTHQLAPKDRALHHSRVEHAGQL